MSPGPAPAAWIIGRHRSAKWGVNIYVKYAKYGLLHVVLLHIVHILMHIFAFFFAYFCTSSPCFCIFLHISCAYFDIFLNIVHILTAYLCLFFACLAYLCTSSLYFDMYLQFCIFYLHILTPKFIKIAYFNIYWHIFYVHILTNICIFLHISAYFTGTIPASPVPGRSSSNPASSTTG